MIGFKKKEASQIQVVVFCLKEEEFAIDIQQMREVLKPIYITPLPHSADFIEGVINLRGEIIPVIDLRKRFGINQESLAEKKRIMIIEIADNLLGIIVDQVLEVLHLSGNQIQSPPQGLYGTKSDFISGIGKKDNRFIIILSPAQIISCEEKIDIRSLKELKELISEHLEDEIA